MAPEKDERRTRSGARKAEQAPAKSAAAKNAAPAKSAPVKKTAPAKATSAKATSSAKDAAPARTARKAAPAQTTMPAKTVRKAAVRVSAGSKAAAQKARTAPRSKFFAQAQKRAASLVRQPEELVQLVQKAQRKRFKSGPVAELVTEFKALLRLIRAYAKGEYRDVSKESMIIMVGAVLYVVSPIDLIPDFLPAGLLDDAAVLAFAFRMVQEEVEAFLAWEQAPRPRS